MSATPGGHNPMRDTPTTLLTAHELELLQALADGDGYIAVARNWHNTLGTVKNTSKRMLNKLGADNKTHAVALALRRGLIK